jgi:prevent-host-death family protein
MSSTHARCDVVRCTDDARVHGMGLVMGPELGGIVLYDSYMTEMAVSEAREHLAEVIDSAQRTGEPVYLTRRGRAVAVVVDPVVFEKLLDDAEDALDRAELALARDEDDYIPWEQVKADLGLK